MIIVSAPVQIIVFLDVRSEFGACWDRGLGAYLDTGLTIDNFLQIHYILAVLVLGPFVGGQPMNPSVMRSGTRENQLPVL